VVSTCRPLPTYRKGEAEQAPSHQELEPRVWERASNTEAFEVVPRTTKWSWFRFGRGHRSLVIESPSLCLSKHSNGDSNIGERGPLPRWYHDHSIVKILWLFIIYIYDSKKLFGGYYDWKFVKVHPTLTYIHMYIYTCTLTYIHTSMHTCIHRNIHTNIRIDIHTMVVRAQI